MQNRGSCVHGQACYSQKESGHKNFTKYLKAGAYELPKVANSVAHKLLLKAVVMYEHHECIISILYSEMWQLLAVAKHYFFKG